VTELEQRIYRDAASAAAEITADDIPPLQLDGRRAGATGRRSVARQRSELLRPAPGAATRRILAPLAAAVCVIAVSTLVFAAVHGTPAGSQRARPPVATASQSRASHLLITEALDWYFPASGATYTNGLTFGWTQDKITARDIDPCLRAAGYPQPPFSGSAELARMSFANISQFPDLAQLAASPAGHVFTKQYPVVKDPTNARMRTFDGVQARCTDRWAQSVTRVNTAAAQLQTAWLGIISAIESSARVSATQPAFASCLEAHGVPASVATETSRSSNPLFHGYFAWADSRMQSATTAAELNADQRHDTRVFIACARPVISVLEPIQLARRTAFFRQHAAQIARISRLAAEMGS
jgi:hypothetical protein